MYVGGIFFTTDLPGFIDVLTYILYTKFLRKLPAVAHTRPPIPS